MSENTGKIMILEKPVFVWLVMGVILFSVFCFSLETLPDLSPSTKVFLEYSELCVIIIFTIEYLIRILCSGKPLRFIFSFYGLIDLLAILPFYLAFAVDLRAIRLIRVLRLVQVLKLVRYNSALKRFARALYIAKEELIVFTLISLVILYLSAVGIYHFEHAAQPDVFRSIFDALWWSVATLTTVGYGDIYPITNGGRFFTFIILMVGLGLIAVPTGIFASALSSVRQNK